MDLQARNKCSRKGQQHGLEKTSGGKERELRRNYSVCSKRGDSKTWKSKGNGMEDE